MSRDSVANYYHADGLGSITSLTNTAEAVSTTYSYDAFGNIVNSAGSVVNPYRYTGREWDSDTGLYYYGARYYDPSVGRFLSEDPARFDGGINFYAYVRNRPTRATDPSGLVTVVPLPNDASHVHVQNDIDPQCGITTKLITDPISFARRDRIANGELDSPSHWLAIYT